MKRKRGPTRRVPGFYCKLKGQPSTVTTLDTTRLNAIWRSGYCETTVEFGKNHAADPDARVAFMRTHLEVCNECRYANTMKDLESRISAALGFTKQFLAGEDVTLLPGFEEEMKRALGQLMKSENVDATFFVWLASVAERKDYEKERPSQRVPWVPEK